MRSAHRPSLKALAFTLPLLATPFTTASAGTYLLSPSAIANSLDSIVHPLGYNGTGGSLTIDVCVDPSSPSADLFPGPLGRAIATWNALQPTTGTYVPPGQSTEVPPDTWDVESILLHELGHCANALQHDNLGTSVLFFFDTATWSTMGPDNEFSFVFIGADNRWGTRDDDRGDDENLFWFRKDLNDPFLIDPFPPPPVDSSTYSRNLADLPMGHDYAANGSPAVAQVMGYPNTRSVLYEQTGPQSEFRSLSNDNVDTVLYGRTGIDEDVSTAADNYSLTLNLTSFPCDIPVFIDPNFTGLAVCTATPTGPIGGGDHYTLVPMRIRFGPNFPLYFGPSPNLEIAKDDGGVMAIPGQDLSYTISVANIGQLDSTGVEVEETVPDNTMFNAVASDPGWSCTATTPGSQCLFPVGTLTAGGPATDVVFIVTVDDPLPPGTNNIVNVVSVGDDGASGPDADPVNNTAQTSTPTAVGMVFADGFESGDTSAWTATVP